MKQYKRLMERMHVVILYYAISFFSLSFIPLVYKLPQNARKIPQMIIAVCFWLFLLAAIVKFKRNTGKLFQIRQDLAARGYRIRQKRDGMLNFSKKRSRQPMYLLGAAGLLSLITDSFFGWLPRGWFFPLLSLTLFIIAYHAVIDGRNYRTVLLLGKCLEDGKNEKNA